MIPIPLEEPRSECCDAKYHDPGYPDNDICSDCKEHSEPFEEEKEITEEEYMRWHIKRGTPHSAMKNMREDFRQDFLMKPFYELENPSKEIISLPKEKDELIHKRMNDINTFQAHENEVYLRGTDEYGKDFQICFDSYNFLEWIDTEHLEYIKEQLIKYIKTK